MAKSRLKVSVAPPRADLPKECGCHKAIVMVPAGAICESGGRFCPKLPEVCKATLAPMVNQTTDIEALKRVVHRARGLPICEALAARREAHRARA